MNVFSVLRSMRPTLLLMGGRGVGFLVAFAIPMVLARTLDAEQFGTYRLLFLIYGTLLSVAQLGMAESLYYFLPQRQSQAGSWAGNTAATLGVVGGIAAMAVALAASVLGARFNNPLLAHELPKLGIFLGLMLASTGLEIVMVCRQQYRNAAVAYATFDVIRALLFVTPALLMRSLDALLLGAIAFALVRCAVAAIYLRREFGRELTLNRGLWREQLRYAVPFAAAVVVELAQNNLHQYAVALWFAPATFAIYSIGCLQIPIVDLLANSAANVMMVSMSERIANGRPTERLWHETVERLAFVFFPMVAVLVLTAREWIVLLFTNAYLGSVPVFAVSVLFIALAAFPVDAVLRVYAETRTLLMLSAARLVLIAASIGWFVSRFHLPGAVLVTLCAAATTKMMALVRVRRLIGVPWRRLLPWPALGWIAAASLVAVVPAWFVKSYFAGALVPAAVGTALAYGVCYLALVSGGAMLRPGAADPAAEPSGAV